jgi:RNA polymerase sigma factor (sigma-70 family)
MQNMSDAELLKEYADAGSEKAFREIVERYTDLVYSAAVRQVQSSDLARDIAQTVFLDLSRKAKTLATRSHDSTLVIGWLYRSTRYASLNLLRSEHRRQNRELEAMKEFNSPEAAMDWERLGAVLDEAMTQLSVEDRDALLLRYFKNNDFRSVGAALGISDDAAQKRVSRAIEKLREHLGRMGITAGAAALTVAIGTNAVQAAPAGLSVAIWSGVVASASATAAAIGVQTTMHWINAKMVTTVLAAALVSATGTYLLQQSKMDSMQAEKERLVSQQESLSKDREDALVAGVASQEALKRAEKERSELLRLRNEVGLLRQKSNELVKAAAENEELRTQLKRPAQPLVAKGLEPGQTHFPKESWGYAGYASPEAAAHTWTWAMSQGKVELVLESIAPEAQARFKDRLEGSKAEELAQEIAKGLKLWGGYDITERKDISENEVHLKMAMYKADGSSVDQADYKIKKIGDLWKFAGPAGPRPPK